MTRESNGDATAARRAEVVRRLLERGMSVRALEALLPGWEGTIAEVAATGEIASA